MRGTLVTERLRIEDVWWTAAGEAAEARVSLCHRGRRAEGQARLPLEAWREAVAQATLQAVRALVAGVSEVALDAVSEVRSGRCPLVVVTLTRGRGRGGSYLSGTAVLGDDGGWAVARAVLHGLNRWIEPRLDGQTPDAGARTTPGPIRPPG